MYSLSATDVSNECNEMHLLTMIKLCLFFHSQVRDEHCCCRDDDLNRIQKQIEQKKNSKNQRKFQIISIDSSNATTIVVFCFWMIAKTLHTIFN